MEPPIGIMQGRLSAPVNGAIQAFPANCWQEEFALARKVGLAYVEWIFDAQPAPNPAMHADGISRMRALTRETGVTVPSLCADYFMTHPLLRGSEPERKSRREMLERLLRQCAIADIQHVTLPFVDQSRLLDAQEQDELVLLLRSVESLLKKTGVEVHLETSLAPEPFAALMRKMASTRIKINYDTGNSASLGYDPNEEFAAYGNWIGSVHIKDRLRGGGTVPLGRGDVDFPAVARLLQEAGYAGGYTLQVARDLSGDEVASALRNQAFWRDHLRAT